MKRRSLVISIIVVFLVIVWTVASGTFDRFRGPEYVRAAQIKDVAWGTDGSLYMMVQWVVKERRGSQALGSSVVEFDEDAVYRLDPDERVVRRLPMDEARAIVERWPNRTYGRESGRASKGSGWVGGSYVAQVDIVYDTFITDVKTSSGKSLVAAKGERYGGTWLREWESGESWVIPAFFKAPQMWRIDEIDINARVAPDDRYVVYQDTPAKILRIRWLPDGKEDIVPDSVIPRGSDIYPTTRGLLDPKRQVLINPETWEMTEGWYVPNYPSNQIPGSDGASRVVLDPRGRDVAISIFPRGERPFGANYTAGFRTTFSFSSESVKGSYPQWWKDLDKYPEVYEIPFERIMRPE